MKSLKKTFVKMLVKLKPCSVVLVRVLNLGLEELGDVENDGEGQNWKKVLHETNLTGS